jgi:outer membrane protein assembly factor BamB
VVLGVVTGLVSVAGGVAGVTRLDLERRRGDPGRLEQLARTCLPPGDRPPGLTTDWPQWRGPNRDGAAPAPAAWANGQPGQPRLVWTQAIGRGFSSVAVVNGRVYTMEEESPPAGPGTPPPGRCEAVTCRDARDGREVWRFRSPGGFDERFGPGPRSTPAVDDGHVYAVGATGAFHCLRADTGAVVWRHDLLEEFHGPQPRYGVSFSPLVDGELVYATPGGPGGNAVVAFDKHTGRVAWKALDDEMGYSSPVVAELAGVRQLLVLTNEALVSLSPADGTVLWRYPWQADNGFNVATPLAFGDYVFISSAYRKGCALLEVTAEAGAGLRPHRVYEHNRMRNHFASSVRRGDYLYGFDEMDLVCMDVRTGQDAWREKGGRSFRKGSLILVGDYLVLLGEGGTLALAEATPAGYRETGSFRVSENKCWTVPAWADSRLYVRDESQLACLDLPGGSD